MASGINPHLIVSGSGDISIIASPPAKKGGAPSYAQSSISPCVPQHPSAAAKVPRKVSEIGDSDDELSDLASGLSLVSRAVPVKVEAMTIPCLDEHGRTKNIKGSKLIEIAHRVIQNSYDQVVDLACEYEKDIGGTLISPPQVKDGIISINASRDWLMSLGGWKGMMPSEEVNRCFFDLPTKDGRFAGARIYDGAVFVIKDHRIHIPEGFVIGGFDVTKTYKKTFAGWAETHRTDLSYKQILKAIDHIKKTFNLTDSKIAALQLCAFSRESLPPAEWVKIAEENQTQVLQFLDYLNALMFGIEASGLNAAMIIGFLTLDLIVDGELNYQTAFNANDDGGFYPYACFGDNKGTYSARETILLHGKTEDEPLSMKAFRQNPSRSPVANKEAILIKKWVEFNGIVDPKGPYEAQLKNIEKAIDDLFTRYFSPWIE